MYLSTTSRIEDAIDYVEDWSFSQQDSNLYNRISLADAAPGSYYLLFLQEAGIGYFEYTISRGGGTTSHFVALVIGFLLACSLVLSLTLILTIVAFRS